MGDYCWLSERARRQIVVRQTKKVEAYHNPVLGPCSRVGHLDHIGFGNDTDWAFAVVANADWADSLG